MTNNNYLLYCKKCGILQQTKIDQDLPGDWGFRFLEEDYSISVNYQSPGWNSEDTDHLFCSEQCFFEHEGIIFDGEQE